MQQLWTKSESQSAINTIMDYKINAAKSKTTLLPDINDGSIRESVSNGGRGEFGGLKDKVEEFGG